MNHSNRCLPVDIANSSSLYESEENRRRRERRKRTRRTSPPPTPGAAALLANCLPILAGLLSLLSISLQTHNKEYQREGFSPEFYVLRPFCPCERSSSGSSTRSHTPLCRTILLTTSHRIDQRSVWIPGWWRKNLLLGNCSKRQHLLILEWNLWWWLIIIDQS